MAYRMGLRPVLDPGRVGDPSYSRGCSIERIDSPDADCRRARSRRTLPPLPRGDRRGGGCRGLPRLRRGEPPIVLACSRRPLRVLRLRARAAPGRRIAGAGSQDYGRRGQPRGPAACTPPADGDGSDVRSHAAGAAQVGARRGVVRDRTCGHPVLRFDHRVGGRGAGLRCLGGYSSFAASRHGLGGGRNPPGPGRRGGLARVPGCDPLRLPTASLRRRLRARSGRHGQPGPARAPGGEGQRAH